MIRGALMVVAAIFTSACTDAYVSKVTSLGSEHSIKCYSGERLIYEGTSTGKVASESQSDGYFFTEKGTGKLMQVSGNCVIERAS